jgi:hypothetical protein
MLEAGEQGPPLEGGAAPSRPGPRAAGARLDRVRSGVNCAVNCAVEPDRWAGSGAAAQRGPTGEGPRAPSRLVISSTAEIISAAMAGMWEAR